MVNHESQLKHLDPESGLLNEVLKYFYMKMNIFKKSYALKYINYRSFILCGYFEEQKELVME